LVKQHVSICANWLFNRTFVFVYIAGRSIIFPSPIKAKDVILGYPIYHHSPLKSRIFW